MKWPKWYDGVFEAPEGDVAIKRMVQSNYVSGRNAKGMTSMNFSHFLNWTDLKKPSQEPSADIKRNLLDQFDTKDIESEWVPAYQ